MHCFVGKWCMVALLLFNAANAYRLPSPWREKSSLACSKLQYSKAWFAETRKTLGNSATLAFWAISTMAYPVSASPAPIEGNCVNCLGVVNQLLAECPGTPTCVSSQDDRHYNFLEPWQYDTTQARAMRRLSDKLESIEGVKIIKKTEDYLRVEFHDMRTGSVDDAEWYFTPNDSIIQFRAARRDAKTDFAANRRRMENLRIALGYEKIPVLRNRQRALVFFESPLDSFGPATIRDMTPEEMDAMELYRGDLDPRAPAWEAPSKQMRALKNMMDAQIDDRVRSK